MESMNGMRAILSRLFTCCAVKYLVLFVCGSTHAVFESLERLLPWYLHFPTVVSSTFMYSNLRFFRIMPIKYYRSLTALIFPFFHSVLTNSCFVNHSFSPVIFYFFLEL